MFKESLYEHNATVTCVEKNFKDNHIFATASRDNTVCIWKFIPGQD
jgi:WD40 repeat protein